MVSHDLLGATISFAGLQLDKNLAQKNVVAANSFLILSTT